MLIQTADTAKRKSAPKVAASPLTDGPYASVAEKISKMSSSDVLASLRRAGIITTKGKLAAKYKKK